MGVLNACSSVGSVPLFPCCYFFLVFLLIFLILAFSPFSSFAKKKNVNDNGAMAKKKLMIMIKTN